MGRIGRWVGICVVALSACSSDGGPNPTSTTATPSGKPTPIDGAYVQGERQLVMTEGGFRATVQSGLTFQGTVVVDGPSATFTGGPGCTQPGIYTRVDSGGALQLIPGNDPCEVRATALGGTWTPVPDVGRAASGELALLSDGESIARFEGAVTASGSDPQPIEAFSTEAGFAFSPTVIRGDPGQEIQVRVTNDDRRVRHSFVIENQGVDVDLPAVDTADHVVTVTIPESGAVTFLCKYHRYQFMLGQLQAT